MSEPTPDPTTPTDPDAEIEAAAPAPARGTGALPHLVAGVIVFYATGAVLVLEVVGLRLLAPYVGVTLQTSSAVIGTALAAIALGAWTGGRLADRVDPRRLLPPALVIAGFMTGISLPLVRAVGPMLASDDPVSIAILAFVAVFAPSISLATVTPMVVKLQLRDLGRTGSVVGRLSGIGTLGGIVATFGTGFVLLAALPSSAIVFGLAGMTVLIGVGLAFTRGAWRRPAPPLVLLCVLSTLLPAVTPSPCQVETAYHCARVAQDPARPTGRYLVLDNLLHSYVDASDPTFLDFPYVQAIASVADVMRPPGQPISALHLGAGGMTIPRYLAATRPGTASRVLEIDGGVVALDRSELALGDVPRLTVRIGDARVGLRQEAPDSRDLVVGDAFGGLAVPWHLTTREVVQMIARVLRPGGIYAVNIIDFPPNAFVRAEVATIESVFPQVAIVASPDALRGEAGGNFVVLASAVPLPLPALRARLAQRGTVDGVDDGAAARAFAGGAQVLTDDHAPVDQLITHRGRL